MVVADRPGKSIPQRKDSWEAAFPASQDNESDRLRFMARMSYISIAHFLLYRKITGPRTYKRRRVGNDTVIYCFDPSTRWGGKLSHMMQGLKEAIEKKFVDKALIIINEGGTTTEVFIIQFCYDEGGALKIVNDEGQPILFIRYVDEKQFRHQTRHMIKKINAVTKKLTLLNPGAFAELKLTYLPGVPDDYEPPYFVRCDGTYKFTTKPIFYNLGHISSKNAAIAFHLKSIYLNQDKINDLEDLLTDQAGLVEGQHVDPKDVSKEIISDEEESPGYGGLIQSPDLEVPRSIIHKYKVFGNKASISNRALMQSPEDEQSYD